MRRRAPLIPLPGGDITVCDDDRRGVEGGSDEAFKPPCSSRSADSGYREELRLVLEDMLDDRADTRPGLMFGFPAFYAVGKLVACVYRSGIGLRVPPEQASRPRGAPTRAFEPYGRLMRAWAFLEPPASDDLRGEEAVLEAAIDRAKRAGKGK